MSNKHIFDQIVDEVKNDPIPEIHLEKARLRTLEKMVKHPTNSALEAVDVKNISSCDDFQKLIPAYIAKELSEARMLLVQDHTRSCVPCRRFLQDTKASKKPAAVQFDRVPEKKHNFSLMWKVAASILLFSLAGLGYRAFHLNSWFTPEASIKIVEGSFYSLSNNQLVLMPHSSVLSYGQEVRAPRDSNATFELEDGTMVEMARRSIFKVEQSEDGVAINLLAGKAIVEAADQHDKHLYVNTPDCQVSVKGTVFSVNSGPKGSRVTVFDGEVHVKKGKTTAVLKPGSQFTSEKSLKHTPLKREVAWSESKKLQPFLKTLHGATAQLEADLALEGTRYSSQLLPLMPGNTRIYGAVPNIGEGTVEIIKTIEDQLKKYPDIQKALTGKGPYTMNVKVNEALDMLSLLSSYFGSELAFSVYGTDAQSLQAPLFLAESSGKEGLEDFIRTELTRLGSVSGVEDLNPGDHLVFINDPQTAVAVEDTLYIWLHEGIYAASIDIEALRSLQQYIDSGQNPEFINNPFYQTLDELYQTGLSVVFGLDVSEFIPEDDEHDVLKESGLAGLDDFIFLKRAATLDSSFEANFTFKDSRTGFAAWIAEPSPLESLSFISPEVTAFASISLINPEFMMNDLLNNMKYNDIVKDIMDSDEADIMDLLQDLAVALGGEITIALDGPILPEPHWKIVAELYNAALFKSAVDEIIVFMNDREDLELSRETSEFNGLEVSEIRSQKYGWNFYFTEIDGYLLVVPNLSLLDQTQKNRKFNLSIAASEKFISLLPSDSYNEFSGLIYQDLGRIFNAPLKLLSGASQDQKEKIKMLQATMTPKMVYMYADRDRISMAATGGESLFNALFLHLMNPELGKIDVLEQLLDVPDVD